MNPEPSTNEEYEIVSNTKAKSNVWKYFGLKRRKSNKKVVERLAVCRKCGAEVQTAGGTTNIHVSVVMIYN